MKTDLVKFIIDKLPPFIELEGCVFNFSIFINHSHLRICYSLDDVDKDSKHYNSFKEFGTWMHPFYNRPCSFLYLVENIVSQDELFQDLLLTYTWLKAKKLAE